MKGRVGIGEGAEEKGKGQEMGGVLLLLLLGGGRGQVGRCGTSTVMGCTGYCGVQHR